MRHSIEMEKLTLGVCYYPEHWDRALWKDDLQRMKQYGIEVIRLAEFSWALMEPEEGKYDFSFWDEFLALAAEVDLCQYFEHKKLKGYADFFNSSSSFCCGVI